MVYNQEHMLLQWHGTFRLGAQRNGQAFEEVTGQLRFAGPGIENSESDQVLAGLAIVLSNYWGELGAAIPGNCFLDTVKWNRINVDGAYKSPTNTRATTMPGYGGTKPSAYPTQVAWATTWQTDAVRGLAAKGRTYWPTGINFDSNTLLVTPTNCLTSATLGARLIRELNEASRNGYVENYQQPIPDWAVALGWDPNVVREGSGLTASVMSKIGAGVTRPITSVGVGTRLDIQRRRGNQMNDTRTVVDIGPEA